ncbi:hypothetical protein [Williamsia serinedens]|uniref:Uncharacterized protein n=1 Tax=Williamsia serinedens TaxID=391736 RepID=A0ABT1H7F3_9NOCA|nr:hypothetical protein [Williamsia serinedens]MCP2162657.1 hypothetical protein [Williamsia serinedens]
MELHRELNPDWAFADPHTFLLAEIATLQSSLRFLTAQQLVGFDEDGNPNDVPETFWPATYGPHRTAEEDQPDEPQHDSDDDVARAVADELLLMQGISRGGETA